jgi:putative endonuclease
VRAAIACRESSVRETRVSSQATMSAERSASIERGLASARLPMGVATTKSVPARGQPLGRRFVKPAMNRAGARAEELCAELLARAGLRVLERNWRCRHGEIDLIAEERGTLVFAEVRLRQDERFGGAAESVTGGKRARLIAAARLYLSLRPEAECRFDVLLLDALDPGRIRWVRNAFEA